MTLMLDDREAGKGKVRMELDLLDLELCNPGQVTFFFFCNIFLKIFSSKGYEK